MFVHLIILFNFVVLKYFMVFRCSVHFILLCLGIESLKQLYTITTDVHSRFGNKCSSHDYSPSMLFIGKRANFLFVVHELNILLLFDACRIQLS